MKNNKKYVLFGAGANGRNLADILTSQKVAFIIDNDNAKNGTFYKNIPIVLYDYAKDKLSEYTIVISVS
ncbi:MAG: biotin synthase, partial [Oscillospiraceae bacterium]